MLSTASCATKDGVGGCVKNVGVCDAVRDTDGEPDGVGFDDPEGVSVGDDVREGDRVCVCVRVWDTSAHAGAESSSEKTPAVMIRQITPRRTKTCRGARDIRPGGEAIFTQSAVGQINSCRALACVQECSKGDGIQGWMIQSMGTPGVLLIMRVTRAAEVPHPLVKDCRRRPPVRRC